MTKFGILLHRRAHEYLSELNPEDRRRIIDKLKQLEGFPEIQL